MLNYTVRPVLWTAYADKNGLHRLKICVTINRKQTYVSTPYRLTESEWDGTRIIGNQKANTFNAALRKQISEIEEKLNSNFIEGQQVTARSLKDMPLESYARLIRYDKTRIQRILKFKPGCLMSEVDLAFLRRFKDHELTRGSHPNTIHSTFKYLGQLLRQATKEGVIRANPMLLFPLPKYTKPTRDFLTADELKKLWKLLGKPMDGSMRSTLVYFLLACYSGLRHSDWQTFNPHTMYKDNLLRLRAYKNDQDIVIPVGPSLRKLILLTKKVDPALSNQKCNGYLKAIAALAGLDKKITCHTARHTAGNLFASNGLNISIVAKLLAITESTAQVYFHLSGANITKQAAVLKGI